MFTLLRYIIFFSILLTALAACSPSPYLELARQAESSGDLVGAHGYYNKILLESPKDIEVKQARESVRKQIAINARDEADSLISKEVPVTTPTLISALTIIENARPYDPSGKYLVDIKTQYTDALKKNSHVNEEHAWQAKSAISSNKFEAAKKKIDSIKQIDPEYEALPQLEQEYIDEYGKFLDRKILESFKKGNVKNANNMMQDWLALGFSSDKKAKMKEKIKNYEIDLLRDQVNKLIDKQQFYKAYTKLLNSNYQEAFRNEIETIKSLGGRFYLNRAREYRLNENNDRAYLDVIKGLELDPNMPGLFEMHRDTRDNILKRIQKYIAIPAFGSPNNNPDLGTQISDALISYLFSALPYGINIVERGKIDLLIEEHRRQFNEVADILNVDLIITGNVSLFNIEQLDNKQQSTVRVKTGEKKILNPEYEIFLKTQASKSKTDPPPKIILKPEYENFTYRKGRGSIKGFATVAVQIYDKSKGAIILAREFNAQYQAADDYQDSLELADVKGNPLELPAKTEVHDKLKNDIIEQLAMEILKLFEKREKDFLEEAKYNDSRKEPNKTVGQLAQGFLYCVKANIDRNNADCSAIRKLIIEQTEN